MPQLLALEVCLGTSSGEGGLTMEGIEAGGAFLPSDVRPRFFLGTNAGGAGAAAKLAAADLDGPAAAQKGSAIVVVTGYRRC